MQPRILLFLLLLSLRALSANAQGSAAEAQARQLFADAEALAAANQFSRALELYEASLRAAPSSAAPLLGMGICLAALGRNTEAVERFDQYLDRGRSPENRAQAEQSIRSIMARAGLGTLRVFTGSNSAEVRVDGREINPQRLDRVRLWAGEHRVELRGRGRRRNSRTVNVGVGEIVDIRFDLAAAQPTPAVNASTTQPAPSLPPLASGQQPTPEPTSRPGIHRRWWFWTVVGVAVTGLAVGLGVGLSQQDSTPSSDWRWELP